MGSPRMFAAWARLGLLLLLGACAATPPAVGPGAALLWTVRATDGRFLGSATAIGPRRLLTNAHVVAHATTVLVRPPGASSGRDDLPVHDIRRGLRSDAALLELPVAVAARPAELLAPPLEGAGLTIAGAIAGSPRHGEGHAAAASLAERFGPGLAAAHLPVAPGFSGGPILDAEGHLVGIVAAAVAESPEAARRLSATDGESRLKPRLVLYVPLAVALRDTAAAE